MTVRPPCLLCIKQTANALSAGGRRIAIPSKTKGALKHAIVVATSMRPKKRQKRAGKCQKWSVLNLLRLLFSGARSCRDTSVVSQCARMSFQCASQCQCAPLRFPGVAFIRTMVHSLWSGRWSQPGLAQKVRNNVKNYDRFPSTL